MRVIILALLVGIACGTWLATLVLTARGYC